MSQQEQDLLRGQIQRLRNYIRVTPSTTNLTTDILCRLISNLKPNKIGEDFSSSEERSALMKNVPMVNRRGLDTN